MNPLFRDFNPYNTPILSIDLLHRKVFDCFHANLFLPNGLSRESVHNFCLGGSHRTSSRQECFICFSLRCSPLLHPWILNSSVLKTRMKFLNLPENNSHGVICKTNIVACSSSQKNISREFSRKFFRSVVNFLSWKLLTMGCMRDLCIRHKLIHGTLLSESISTLRSYFGTQWLW